MQNNYHLKLIKYIKLLKRFPLTKNRFLLLMSQYLQLQSHYLQLQNHYLPLQNHYLPLQSQYLPLQRQLRKRYFPAIQILKNQKKIITPKQVGGNCRFYIMLLHKEVISILLIIYFDFPSELKFIFKFENILVSTVYQFIFYTFYLSPKITLNYLKIVTMNKVNYINLEYNITVCQRNLFSFNAVSFRYLT